MSQKRLIVVVHEGEYQRIYHMKAKLKTRESLSGKYNLFVRLKATSDGITNCEYVDHCSVMITISRAWTGDWERIEREVLRVLISEVRWMYKKVHVQHPKPSEQSKLRVKFTNKDIVALRLVEATP